MCHRAGITGMSEVAPAGRLRVGSAVADITPDRPLPLEGYGARTAPATGTLDRLEAQAIVFDDGERRAALVCADLCGLEAPSVARIRASVEAATGLPGDALMVTYSHTHAAPAVTPFAGVAVDADYLRWMESRISDAVIAATRGLRPATLGVGAGAMDFNVNRRRRTPEGMVMRANPAGLVDRRVRVLRLDPADAPAPPGTLGGRPLPQADPLALLFAYPCHATVLGADNLHYSADFPGAARRFVERVYASTAAGAAPDGDGGAATPGQVSAGQATGPAGATAGTRALYLPGCFGNLRPHLLRPDGSFRPGTVHELAVLGRQLGSEVVQVAERVEGEPLATIAVARREVRLPYGHVPDAAQLRAALDGPRRAWARTMLARLDQAGRLPDHETAEVQVLRLGRHWLLATPGETTLEIGQSIERGLVELGLAHPEHGDLALAVGYANGYAGYLCAASLILEGGYEPGDFPSYLRPGPFAPEIEPILVNTALALAQELAQDAGRTA